MTLLDPFRTPKHGRNIQRIPGWIQLLSRSSSHTETPQHPTAPDHPDRSLRHRSHVQWRHRILHLRCWGRGDLDHKDGVKGRIMLEWSILMRLLNGKKTIGFNWDFKKINGPINGIWKGHPSINCGISSSISNISQPHREISSRKSGIEPAQLGDFHEDLAI
jgi:hypothetical protein